MQVPEYIEVKNVSGQRVAFLSPDDGLKNCNIDTRLNGESTLEFLLPPSSEKLDKLTPECRIIADGREFIILKDDATDFERTEDNKLWAKVMSVESWYLLDTQYPEPYITNDPLTPTPADLAVIIVGGGSDLSGGRYPVGSAGHALYAVLNGSGWSVGTVDVTGIHDLEMEKVSRLALVKAIQEIWGGYLVWDSINKTVSLRNAVTWQPYNGFQVRYAKNLKHITRTQSNRIITKLYAFGHDDLDIASVNGGKKYVTNFSYTSREYVGIYRSPDIYDPQELKEAAEAYLELICRPQYLYKLKVVDLRTLPEYSHEDFSLGDMVDVIDPDIAPDSPRVRIIQHKYNVFKPWECELEMGDPEERLIEKLKATFGTSGFIEDIFSSRGFLSGFRVEDGSIAANKIKTDQLIVGTNIAMGPDATISWSKVTGTPSIPILPEYIKSTYIDETNVISPNITGGTITGALFKTAVEGERLEMDSDGIMSFDDDDNKEGIAIENGEWGYSELNFYQNGMIVGGLMNDSYGRMYLSGMNDVELIISDVSARGDWDFTLANISGLNIIAKLG